MPFRSTACIPNVGQGERFTTEARRHGGTEKRVGGQAVTSDRLRDSNEKQTFVSDASSVASPRLGKSSELVDRMNKRNRMKQQHLVHPVNPVQLLPLSVPPRLRGESPHRSCGWCDLSMPPDGWYSSRLTSSHIVVPDWVLRWINGFEHFCVSLDWPCCWSCLRRWSVRAMSRCER